MMTPMFSQWIADNKIQVEEDSNTKLLPNELHKNDDKTTSSNALYCLPTGAWTYLKASKKEDGEQGLTCHGIGCHMCLFEG